MRRLLVTLLLASSVAFAEANQRLAEARRQFDDLELEKAVRTLAAAASAPGNSRAEALEILELQGLAYGTLNKAAKAHDAFRELLTLNPEYTLPKDQPPRVRTPFYEAKAWVSENDPLQLALSTPGCEQRACTPTVTVRVDKLRLVKKARFTLRSGPEPRTRVVDLAGGVANAPTSLPGVEWRVALLNAAGSALIERGPERAGVLEPEPVASAGPPLSAVAAVSTSSGPPLRSLGYATAGAGVVGLGIGLAFGVMSSQARAQISGAAVGPTGITASLTQREAAALEARAREQALVANVLFVAGGALVATGVVLFIVGAPAAETSASLVVTPTSLALTGSLP